MNTSNKYLVTLRVRFELLSARAKLKQSTKKRYQSWIRRFLLFCRDRRIALTQDSAKAFLNNYDSQHSVRQGYFALKFLFIVILEEDRFFKIIDIRPRYVWKPRKRRWYNW